VQQAASLCRPNTNTAATHNQPQDPNLIPNPSSQQPAASSQQPQQPAASDSASSQQPAASSQQQSNDKENGGHGEDNPHPQAPTPQPAVSGVELWAILEENNTAVHCGRRTRTAWLSAFSFQCHI
jgi:hypothetical protein